MELDEITHRLKKRLYFVTHEGSTPSFLPRMQETEISFRSETASNNILNMDMGKNFRSEVSPVNEEGNLDLNNTVADPASITAGYSKFSENSNDTEKLNLKVAEENYNIPRISSQKCENVKNSLVHSLPGNSFVHISSTNSYPLPQSNVTSIRGYLGKGNTNPEVRRTSVNHTSSLAHCTYPYDPSSCKKISSHLRTQGYQIHENWNAGVSRTTSNGTRLLPIKMTSEVEDADDFDKLTHYLMETSAREFELENVFNPLLFHHLLTSCTDMCISGFSKHPVGCYHVSPVVSTNTQPNKDTVKNCSEYEDDAILSNMEVDVARSKHLINDIEENYDMNDIGTLERNTDVAEDNRTLFHTGGEIVANVSASSDMNSVSLVEVSHVNHSAPYDISLYINKQQDTTGDTKCSCVCADSQYETASRAISEWQASHTVGNRGDVHSRTCSSSDVFLSNCSMNKLEFSHSVDLDKTSRDTQFVLRQVPEGGGTTEEKGTVNADAVLESPIETLRIRNMFHSTKGQKQGEENSCTKRNTSLVRDENHLRPTRLTPSCFKVRFISYKENNNVQTYLSKQVGPELTLCTDA